MKNKVQELAYLVRCFNELGRVIREVEGVKRPTPAQTQQAARWKAARRALGRDIQQALAALPKGVQLVYGLAEGEEQWIAAWGREALDIYTRNGDPTRQGMAWHVVQHHERGG